MITREEILATNDWYLSTYMNGNEAYFWRHRSIREDQYTFEMKIDLGNGYTQIYELDKFHDVNDTLFKGYLKSIDELNIIVNLCDLREI